MSGKGAGVVRLPRAAAAGIRAHAAAAWPEECCGLLSGRAGERAAAPALEIASAHPCRNLAARPARAFEIDPQAWLDLRTALARQGGGAEIVGCYHSHPGGPAAPSPRDLAGAWEPDFLWLVVAVAEGRAGAIGAHLFEAEGEAARRFRALALEIV